MTTLYLARHGETIWHAGNRYTGTSDVPLTETGRRQATELAAWAAVAEPSAIWSSPLSRARATAAPAAAKLGLTITVDAELSEMGFGAAEGRMLSELPPDVVAAFRADPVRNAFPGADDPVAAARRGATALRRIAGRHRGERVLVVAHSTLLRLTLCELLGIPHARYRTVFPELGNCSVTELRLTGPDTALITFNESLGGTIHR
jgi:probable phosphoglycerate mutase